MSAPLPPRDSPQVMRTISMPNLSRSYDRPTQPNHQTTGGKLTVSIDDDSRRSHRPTADTRLADTTPASVEHPFDLSSNSASFTEVAGKDMGFVLYTQP